MTRRHFTLEEISSWLDGETELDPRQQLHMKECAECSRVLEGQRRLRRLARETSPDIPTAAMWREIEGRLTGTHRAARARGPMHRLEAAWALLGRFRLASAGLAGAVALLLVVVLGRPLDRPRSVPAVVTPTPAKVAEPATIPAVAGKGSGEPAPTATRQPAESSAPAKREDTTHQRVDNRTSAEKPAPAGAGTLAAPEAPAASEAPASAAARAPAPEVAAPATRQPTPAVPQPPTAAAAPERATARRAERSKKPAAAMRASESADADTPPRITWTGRAVVITGDLEMRPEPNRLVWSGRVVVTPMTAGVSYVATVDGLTRTLTGRTEAAAAEILLPEEVLRLTR